MLSNQNVVFAVVAVGVVVAIAIVYFLLIRGDEEDAKPANAAASKKSKASSKRTSASSSRPPKRPVRESTSSAPPPDLADLDELSENDLEEITLVTVRLDPLVQKAKPDGDGAPRRDSDFPDITAEEIDEDLEPAALAHPLVADDGADVDLPTMTRKAFLVSAARQTDTGRRRKRNEDRYLVMDDAGVFVVADGMGGYAGGDIAAEIAVDTIEEAFKSTTFDARVEARLPRRALEFVKTFQMANLAIWERATDDPDLQGMGTTLVGCRFALRKKRVYIGHVGDSRCYRLRNKSLKQLTSDHTLANLGVQGPVGAHLVRAVGIGSEVEIDMIMAEPKIGDVYLLCSDGLTKMVKDEGIEKILNEAADLEGAAQALVDRANERGGKDNTTVVLVGVLPADSRTDDGKDVA